MYICTDYLYVYYIQKIRRTKAKRCNYCIRTYFSHTHVRYTSNRHTSPIIGAIELVIRHNIRISIRRLLAPLSVGAGASGCQYAPKFCFILVFSLTYQHNEHTHVLFDISET